MPDASDVPQQKCPACDTIVNVAEADPLARVACPNCGEKFRVERAFDNFVLVETLGVGGMGSVYKARDTRLDRFVALKLLRKDLSADPAEAARLEHEARVTAAVNHPNVVQVYSAGTAHGQVYLVMELVDHGSLDDLMAQDTRVPEAKVLQAGIQVAKGLQAAHEKGLIHRDVKPANILFSDAQTAKIGDFGLAGAAEQKGEARQEIWGTPYYVAPERLNNEPEDFRSDIYSLGATLFHALSGKPPMEGETTSASELRRLKSHPPDLHKVAPDISSETARIINKTLAPDPANRFTTYAHLIDQLQRAYRALHSGTGNAGRSSRAPWGIAAGILILAVIVGAGFPFLKARKAAAPIAAAPQSSSPSPTPDNNAALQQRYGECRRLLLEEKYDQAATAFTRLAADAKDRQPLLSWIRLHSGLAALLQKKTGPARDTFQQIERAGAFSSEKADSELARFFLETSRTLASAGPIRAGAIAEPDPKSVHAFAPFLFAIKDWQLSEFAEAAALLDRFMTVQPAGDLAWINDYKPLAQKYLNDARLYTEWKQSPQTATSASDLRQAAETLKALQGKLQTRGALADHLRDEEKRFRITLTQREKEEMALQEDEHKRLFAQEKPRWLSAWKKQLIADLKTGAFKSAVSVSDTDYQGVVTANESEITLRIGQFGNAPFKWEKFPPNVLLAMSKSFIKPGNADAADRQWLAAIFAHSTGQMEEAASLAELAAKAKPEYLEQKALLLSE